MTPYNNASLAAPLTTNVMLPHGFSFDGKGWVSHLKLRQLNGYDEQFVFNNEDSEGGEATSDSIGSWTKGSFFPNKITRLLSRVVMIPENHFSRNNSSIASSTLLDNQNKIVTRETVEPSGNNASQQYYAHALAEKDDEDDYNSVINAHRSSQQDHIERMIEGMTIGDRTALLLYLRKMTFGDMIQAEIKCNSCGQMNSLELSISNLLRTDKIEAKVHYDIEVDGYSIKTRLLCGKDQTELVRKINHQKNNSGNNTGDGSNIEASNKLSSHMKKIIYSCIVYSKPPLYNSESVRNDEELSDDLTLKIGSKLSELDPLADIVLTMNCPSCKHYVSVPFYIEQFFFEEICARYHQLEYEIHWLAFHYHWSEHDILSLPLTRRKRYVEMISDTLGRGEGEEL